MNDEKRYGTRCLPIRQRAFCNLVVAIVIV